MSLQVIPAPLDKSNDKKNEDDASVYCPEEENSNGEDSDEEETIDDFLNLKRLNGGNDPQQQNFSAKYCNGENVSHPKLPGKRKYFQKMICITPGQTLQHQIN